MRFKVPWLLLACVVGFSALLFWPTLVRDRQFGFRDAAHYYYPLYERVEQEWSAGRIPLWEPEENSGMPLLGNPTAAVLYPLKVIYRLCPSYAWGARLYTITHVILCAFGMYGFMRALRISTTGSCVAALAYAQAGPVLFQTCNIIFLVGAAWAPFGFWAIERWLRHKSRPALLGLAAVLALQVLGGDPEAAYVTGLCACGYAWILSRPEEPRADRPRTIVKVAVAGGLLVLWAGACLAAAVILKRTPAEVGKPPTPHPWTHWGVWVVRAIYATLAAVVFVRWRSKPRLGTFVRMTAGLLAAALIAALICGAQLLPILEFTSQSLRAAAGGPHEIYPFSLEPVRLAELAWPGFFGSASQGETLWLKMVTPDHTPEIWVNSLYLGAATLWLALAALGFRKASPQRVWLSLVLLISIVAAFGKFSSPIWAARLVPGAEELLGSHDPPNSPAIRFDGALRDGEGGLYWAMSTLLPGFGSFRYPSKLLTFSCLALAALAGIGFDRGVHKRSRRDVWMLFLGVAASLVVIGVAFVFRERLIARLASFAPTNLGGIFGPFDSQGAWLAIVRSATQAGVVAAGAAVFLILCRTKPRLGGLLLLLLHTADLYVANQELVITVPQALFDKRPEMLDMIAQAEKERPTPGGHYRVYRQPVWEPYRWREQTDASRYDEFVRWERRTLQPKYGIPYGLEYSLTKGVSELYDYEFFFTAFERTVQDPTLSQQIFGGREGEKLVVFTRRGIDLWNSRYFVLPYRLSNDESRGIAAFLTDIETIEPADPPDETQQEREKRLTAWMHHEDWRLVRNLNAFPRAWVVHDARIRRPINGLNRKDRESLMFEILYPNDPFWNDGVEAFDPRTIAWIETEDAGSIRDSLSRAAPLPSEAPRIVRYEPQRVEIEVDLQTPGIVVLADVYYPGWTLTIDGQPATILRANRLMRGAALPSGKHTLIYRYEPESFRIGALLSGVGLFAALAFAAWAWNFPGPARGEEVVTPAAID